MATHPGIVVVYKITAATIQRILEADTQNSLPAMERTRDVSRLITLPLCIVLFSALVVLWVLYYTFESDDGDDNKIAIAISFHGNKRW